MGLRRFMAPNKSSPAKVAIVGLGTVGTGVARLLLEFGERTAKHAGRPLVLEQVVVRDLKRPRKIDLPAAIVSADIERITKNPEISVVALLVGGLEPARTYLLKLLESGKDVVTANKALLAEHGPELFDRARQLGRSIAFEASVAGGIPIIANISHLLVGQSDRVDACDPQRHEQLHLDANGGWGSGVCTMPCAKPSGWALPKPTRRWTSTAATRHKSWRSWPPGFWRPSALAARSRVAVSTRSMQTDLRFAKELGYRIKLLAVARLTHEQIGTARLAYVGENWHAAGRSSRSLQRRERRGRRRGPGVLFWPGGRPNAHGFGRRGRHDRHGGRPGCHYVPHSGALVEANGPRGRPAILPTFPADFTCDSTSKIARVFWPKSPACWASRNFDRFGDSTRSGRAKRHGAAGDHDA